MKISSFVNDPDGTPLHSSGLTGDGGPAAQSFTERRKIEQQRRIIKGYRHSLIGANFGGDRGQITSTPRPAVGGATPPVTPPQAANERNSLETPPSPLPSFKEPPSRGFNPYS